MANKNEYRIIENPKVPADLFAVGMRQGDKTLRQKIHAGLKKLQQNGKLEQLNAKWFGTNVNYLGK